MDDVGDILREAGAKAAAARRQRNNATVGVHVDAVIDQLCRRFAESMAGAPSTALCGWETQERTEKIGWRKHRTVTRVRKECAEGWGFVPMRRGGWWVGKHETGTDSDGRAISERLRVLAVSTSGELFFGVLAGPPSEPENLDAIPIDINGGEGVPYSYNFAVPTGPGRPHGIEREHIILWCDIARPAPRIHTTSQDREHGPALQAIWDDRVRELHEYIAEGLAFVMQRHGRL